MIQQRRRLYDQCRPKKLLIALWAVMLISAYCRTPADADPVSFYQSFAGNIQFQMTGASLREEPDRLDGGNPCLVTTSRSAQLTDIPAGAGIRHAYLYWAGSGATPDRQVVFQGQATNATRTFTERFVYNGNNYDFFSGFADVTAQVTGNGTYSLSGLTVNTGGIHCGSSAVMSGWSLIVIYEHTAEPLRVINLYDGFRYFRASRIDLTPNNFQIPSSGCGTSGDCKWGVVTWEGDAGNSDDRNGFSEDLFVNAVPMTTPVNPMGNQFNSTIDLLGTQPNPPGNFTYGVDIDIYSPLPLSPGDTSAVTSYQSGQDLVLLSAEVFSVVNTPVADLSITKSHAGDFTVGQQEDYTIRVTNNGPNDAVGAITVTDTLPGGLTYVSGAGTGWTCGATGRNVNCAHPGPLPNAGTLPDLRLTVDVDTGALPSVTNTASVSSPMFDNQLGNNTSGDAANVFDPGPVSGTKLLYFYMNHAPAPDTNTLQRVVNTGSTGTGIISRGNSYTALLSPVTQGPLTLRAGNHPVSLLLRRRNNSGTGAGGGTRDVTVALDYFGGSAGTLGSATRLNILGNRRWQYITFDINLAADVTFNPNTTIRFRLSHEADSSQTIQARSLISNSYLSARSQIALDASTVINVDRVDAFTNVAYPDGVLLSSYPPSADIRVRAVVSDPFGHDDITSATVTILNPDSNPVVTDAAMTEVAPLAPGSPGAVKTFEFPYTIPAGPTGNWTARVTANEGTEGTVSHIGMGSFPVGDPDISIVKTVTAISNPFEGATNAKAIPGAIVEYQIVVTNNGIGPADADSVVITDPLPDNLRLVLNDPIAPVAFTDSASGLTLNVNDVGDNNAPPPYNDIALSNDGGATFLPLGAVTQLGGLDATVPKINFIRINPKGILQGAAGGGSIPSFTLRFRVQVE